MIIAHMDLKILMKIISRIRFRIIGLEDEMETIGELIEQIIIRELEETPGDRQVRKFNNYKRLMINNMVDQRKEPMKHQEYNKENSKWRNHK